MTTLPDLLILSLSSRVSHPWDFTFYNRNGEVANRVRMVLEKEAPDFIQDIKLDSDNDISIKTENCSYYVNPRGIFTSGWVVYLKELTPGAIQEYSSMLDLLFRASKSFDVESYSIQLLFRFTPENALDLLKSRTIDPALQLILADKAYKRVNSFQTTINYEREHFADTLELNVSQSEVQLRYGRNSTSTFDSYGEFLKIANVHGLVEDIASFIELVTPKPRAENKKFSL